MYLVHFAGSEAVLKHVSLAGLRPAERAEAASEIAVMRTRTCTERVFHWSHGVCMTIAHILSCGSA